jgi:AraC-like DNA-binding protein
MLESVLICKQINIQNIATRLYKSALNERFNLGNTLYGVIFHELFLKSPHAAAHAYWESQQKKPASNGALARAPIAGLWQFQNETQVMYQATEICKITHADPRCIASCIAVALAVSRLIQGEEDMDKLIDELAKEVIHFHPDVAVYFTKIRHSSLRVFDLQDISTCNYTLKTLGVAFWCLLHMSSFHQAACLLKTHNANSLHLSITGALFGARFGLKGLPFEHELAHGRDAHWLKKQSMQLYMLNSRINSPVEPSPQSTHVLVEEAIKLMKDGLIEGKNITLSVLCKDLHTNQTTLTECFHKAIHIPPMQYWKVLRLKYAAQLLTESKLSILEIASTCLYETPGSFSTAFKLLFKKSPSDYRREHRKSTA